MPPESVDNPQSSSNPIKEISARQWSVAVVILVAIPIVAYFGAFYLYPYAQDLLEGESPVAAVLTEYGVDEEAETQLLTIRRGDLVNSVAVNGTLEYANRERLSFGTTGTIDTIEFEVGDFVSEGDILMSLESEAIVAAEQKLQNASVALQDAEEKLEDLINPDDKAVNDAAAKVVKARQTLNDAEDALINLLEPSETEIANAELAIAKSDADLEAAEDKLSDLLEPDDIAIENAKLAVAEAEKTLADLIQELADQTAQDSNAIRAAELAVNEAVKTHDDAVEAYEDALNIDETEIDRAELDLEKAQLALVEAEAGVTDAGETLHDAEEGVDDEIASKKLEIAKAEADVATAVITLSDAEEALAEAKKPFDEELVADLQEKIAEAENDIQVAEDQLSRLEIETDANIRKLESDLYDARDAYQDVFFKWIGMDIAKYQWEKSPDEIFADVGKTLEEVMNPGTIYGGLGQRNAASTGWVEDNPDTPWDESVVATWTEFFLNQLRFDCIEPSTSASEECVNIEFENAWDNLLLKTEAYQTAKLANSQQFDNSQDAIDAAQKSLEDFQEQLEEALTPTTDEEIADLSAKQEVAYYTHINAQNKLETLLDELEQIEPDSHVRITKAKQSLAVAEETLTVAGNDVTDAAEKLEDLQAGADEVEIAIALSKADKAESDLIEAIKTLTDLQETDAPDIAVLNQRINVAHADLDDKIAALETLVKADEVEIALAETELASAEQELNDKIAALEELVSPEELDIDLAHQEVAVADADLVAAEEDLESLVNPDPATVALRRAEIATAREELAAAISATEGTQIIAPFDGVIANIPVEEGQTANPNTAAIVIADPSIVEVSGTVDEVDVLFLQVGDPASIELEALGDEALIGDISDIAAFGESNQGVVTYPVTIQTEQPDDTQLPEGLSAVAEVVIREQNDKLLVPIQALFGSVNEPILLVSQDDGTLEPRNVTLGISDDFWTVIEDGVSEGETILMTVVGADTSQFGGFRAITRSVSVSGGPPPGR